MERPELAAVPPARRSVTIAAPRSEVWACIDEPGHLERIHPFCESNVVDAWLDDDHRDRVLYFSGLHLRRTFVEWVPAERFALLIGPVDADPTNWVEWSFADAGAGSCEVTIAIHALAGDAADARASPRRSLERYLDSVLLGLEHVATTGERVRRNQFGSHLIFSPA